MENKKNTDQTSKKNKDQSNQSAESSTSGQSQSQTNNPQKGREQNIVNEQDQANPVNPQEEMNWQNPSGKEGKSSEDYTSEQDMNLRHKINMMIPATQKISMQTLTIQNTRSKKPQE
jgi:hypothetical protein